MRWFRVLVFACLLGLAGCGSRSPDPSLGEAFVGPMTLQLWAELAPRAPVSATLKQGDRVDIVEVRRRFVRVRSAGGAQGWTEAEFLLNKGQVEAYRVLQDQMGDLPAMGVATVYAPLNTHIYPNRVAPSFTQIPEGGRVEVVGHCVTPRGAYQPPKKGRSSTARTAHLPDNGGKSSAFAFPPPPAPTLPENWVHLSRPTLADLEGATTEEQREQADEAPPVPSDDWFLVRMRDGRIGWALSRSLFMAVPDEIAQYAEGHRIMAYFQVGEVNDGGKTHKTWLWATLGAYNVPYQFDTVRYFTWSRRRHRYETSFIDRRLHGYYPLSLIASKSGGVRGFAVIARAADGSLEKRTYQFNDNRVRIASRETFSEPVNDYPFYLLPDSAPTTVAKPDDGGVLDGVWKKMRSLFHRR